MNCELCGRPFEPEYPEAEWCEACAEAMAE